MRIILSELQIKKIVNEVLKDEIPSYMSDIIKKRYTNAPNILDTEIPKHTDMIPNVKTEIEDEKLSQRIKTNIVQHFNMNVVAQYKLSNIAKELDNNQALLFLICHSMGDNNMMLAAPTNGLSIARTPYGTIQSISKLYTKDFLLPTPQSTDISKPVFSKNKSGIATFLKVSKKIFPELKNIDVDSLISDKRFVGLRDPIVNYHTNLDKLLEETKLYLYITDKPDDKLRMSISSFYDSCQNIYSGGDTGNTYNKKLLSNVFDVNSKVAYLIFDVPFTDNMGNEHPFSSIARTIIRVKDKNSVMFDKVYPTDMEEQFYSIIEDVTGLKNEGEDGDVYNYEGYGGLPNPYMDKYELKTVRNRVIDDEKINALVKYFDLTPKNYEITYGEDDNTIKLEDNGGYSKYYKVISRYDMEEKCRDYLLHDITEYIDFQTKTITDLEEMGLVSWDSIMNLIKRIDGDRFEKSTHYSTEEFLDGYLKDTYGIETLKDFENWVNESVVDLTTWYFHNLDIDKVIKIVGGYKQIIRDMYRNIDGSVGFANWTSGGYYIFKMKR